MIIRTNVVAPTQPAKKEAPTKVVEEKIVTKKVEKTSTDKVKKILREIEEEVSHEE